MIRSTIFYSIFVYLEATGNNGVEADEFNQYLGLADMQSTEEDYTMTNTFQYLCVFRSVIRM